MGDPGQPPGVTPMQRTAGHSWWFASTTVMSPLMEWCVTRVRSVPENGFDLRKITMIVHHTMGITALTW